MTYCPHYYFQRELDPLYRGEALVLVMLVGGFALWRWMRPTPSQFVTAMLCVAAVVVIGGVHQLTFGNHCAGSAISEVVFEAAWILTAGVYVELWRAWRSPGSLPRARAQTRRNRSE